MKKTRLLFVCLGNICRSPLAEAMFAHLAAEAGRPADFEADSAGTAAWHTGKPPDPRAIAAATRRGIDLSGQRARQLCTADFTAFDLILAMDNANLSELLGRAPVAERHRVRLFLDDAPGDGPHEVPDPYYGGDDGFDAVLDLIEAGSRRLLDRL